MDFASFSSDPTEGDSVPCPFSGGGGAGGGKTVDVSSEISFPVFVSLVDVAVSLLLFVATFSFELEEFLDPNGLVKVGAGRFLPARKGLAEACALPGIDLHRSNKLGSSEVFTICVF